MAVEKNLLSLEWKRVGVRIVILNTFEQGVMFTERRATTLNGDMLKRFQTIFLIRINKDYTNHVQSYLVNSVVLSACGKHRKVLPVLRYPRNMVIYHYPLIRVIFMVILHVFIIKSDPNLF